MLDTRQHAVDAGATVAMTRRQLMPTEVDRVVAVVLIQNHRCPMKMNLSWMMMIQYPNQMIAGRELDLAVKSRRVHR